MNSEMNHEQLKTAVLVGGTGLVGQYLLDLLMKDPAYQKVVLIGRKKIAIEHSKFEQHQIDFDQIGQYEDLFKGNDFYCSMGTTKRKAGSKEAFIRVDFNYIFQSAQAAVKHGCEKILLVSSVGADSKSMVFYSRTKGQLEMAISTLPFREIHFFRPSLLLGKRQEKRPLERLSAYLSAPFSSLMTGPLQKYRPIPAETVAQAMVWISRQNIPGTHFYESNQLWKLAQRHGV